MAKTTEPKNINPFVDIQPPVNTDAEKLRSLVNGRSLNIGNGDTAFKADRSGIWLGAKTFADAPFKVDMLGNTRANVLTAKSIFFETIAAPAVPLDGELWCADNLPNKKVLWGYFGGDTTHKQQVSMSRMQKSFAFDYTSDHTINISSLWFQPRMIIFNGFVENTAADKYGVTNGQAGIVDPLQGFCNSILLDFSSISNIVSDLAFSNSPSVLSCDSLSCYTIPYVSSYNNNTLFAVDQIKIGVVTDSIGASSADKEVYLYVDTWADTSVTLKLVCPAGWRMAGSLTVIG